jgi:aspartyl-tRNA(Asn)/glutamyl-tRNA(Gln) amidotransferase subunit B
VPLIEIVSEPDIRDAADAREYLQRLREILVQAEVSDANMEEGSLRVDANVSVRRAGDPVFGTRTEIKNMNSFSGVERAIGVEYERQCRAIEAGEPIVQQTMLWDAAAGSVRPTRAKEESHDYRYFPEPDLPPLRLERTWIAAQREELPELPAARRARLRAAHGLSAYEASVLTSSRALADYFEQVVALHADARTVATWLMGEVLAWLKDRKLEIEAFPLDAASLADLLDAVRDGTVSRTAARKVFDLMLREGGRVDEIARREGLAQVGDDAALAAWVEDVWHAHPEETARFAAGEQKLLGVLVGLVMKASGGRADPRRVNQLLQQRATRA